jgi:electron transport complex protein RnfB
MAADGLSEPHLTRRQFVTRVGRGVSACALLGVSGVLFTRGESRETVWQIDPFKCTQCGRCQTECVLDQSAVRCFHDFAMCGYCKFCFGFFRDDAAALNEGAENQACPTGAIARTFVEDPYYQYTIDEDLCIACGKCVKGCTQFGNGSLYLQVRHDICLNCSECAIAVACSADAFVRLPADQPYFIKHRGQDQFPAAYQIG